MEDQQGPFSLDENIAKAEKNLDRQLSWIARYDTRTALLVGIEVAILGYLASQLDISSDVPEYVANLGALFLILKVISFFCLFYGNFPRVKPANKSAIFFGTIAQESEASYRAALHEQSKEQHLDDLAIQIHINATILNTKFRMLKWSMCLMLVSLVPWSILIYLS